MYLFFHILFFFHQHHLSWTSISTQFVYTEPSWKWLHCKHNSLSTQPPSFLYARSSISAYATKLLGGAGGNITSMVICFPAISQLQRQILTLLSKSTTFCWYIFPFTFQVLTTSLSHHLSLSGNDFTSYFIEKIETIITLKNNSFSTNISII